MLPYSSRTYATALYPESGTTIPPFIEEPSQLTDAFGHIPLQLFTRPPEGSKTSSDHDSMWASAERALIVSSIGFTAPFAFGVKCVGSRVIVPVGAEMSRTKLRVSAIEDWYFIP